MISMKMMSIEDEKAKSPKEFGEEEDEESEDESEKEFNDTSPYDDEDESENEDGEPDEDEDSEDPDESDGPGPLAMKQKEVAKEAVQKTVQEKEKVEKKNPFSKPKQEEQQNTELVKLLNSLPIVYYKESKEIKYNNEDFYLILDVRGNPIMLLKEVD